MTDFDAFYAATSQPLLIQVVAYLGDPDRAREVVEEAYTRTLMKWNSISRREDPIVWVRRTVWHLAGRRTRSRVRSSDQLTTALATLPSDQRRIVIMHYLGHLTTDEIGTVEHQPEHIMTDRLNRGKAALAAALDALKGKRHV